jgi:hypothetical protein
MTRNVGVGNEGLDETDGPLWRRATILEMDDIRLYEAPQALARLTLGGKRLLTERPMGPIADRIDERRSDPLCRRLGRTSGRLGSTRWHRARSFRI